MRKAFFIITVAMFACLCFAHLCLWGEDKQSAVKDTYAQLFVCTNAVEALGKIGASQAKDIFIKGLRSKESMLRAASAEALGNVGNAEAFPLLKELIEDENTLVRVKAARALLSLGDNEMEQVLFRFLTDSDPVVRTNAAEQLGNFGNRYASRLTTLLTEEKNEVVKVAVIEKLGWNKYKEAAPFLRQALEDPHVEVVKAACVALGRIGDKESMPALKQRLKDSNPLIRAAAKTGYAMLLKQQAGGKRSQSSPRWLWEDAESSDPMLQATSFVGLAEFNDIKIVPALLAALTNPGNPTFLRREAALALAILKPRVVELANKALGSSGARVISSENLEVAYKVQGKSVATFLVEAMQSEVDPSYKDAPVLLLELRERDALPALREALLQDNPDAVAMIAYVLGEMRDQDAIPYLIKTCAKYGL